MNAPATFMQIMNNLFSDMWYSGVAVILDDIFMYLWMVMKYFMLLETVLVCLQQYTFYCKLKKFSLLHNNTMFISFDIMPEGMHISDSKV